MIRRSAGSSDPRVIGRLPVDNSEPLNWDTYPSVSPHLNPAEKICIMANYGQSQLTNVIPRSDGTTNGPLWISPYRADRCFVINPYDGRLHQMTEPWPGCSYPNSNIMTRVADKLIQSGDFDRVVMCNVAVGGISSRQLRRGGEWNGRMLCGVRRVMDFAATLGRQPTFLLRNQAEAEIGNPEYFVAPIDGAETTANIASEVETIRELGCSSPILISKTAWTPIDRDGARFTITRAALDSAIATIPGCYLGPDTDSYRDSYRGPAGHHFTWAAAPTIADVIVANIRSYKGQFY